SQPSQNQHRYLGDAVSLPQAKRRATVQQEPDPTAYNSETDIRDGDRVTVDVVAGKVAKRPQREACPHKYKQDRCRHDRGRHTRTIEDSHRIPPRTPPGGGRIGPLGSSTGTDGSRSGDPASRAHARSLTDRALECEVWRSL